MAEKRKFEITWRASVWSLGALAAGFVAGIVLRACDAGWTAPVLATLSAIGAIWMNALRMVALPLALFSTMGAMVRERTGRSAGRIAGAFGVYTALLLAGAAMVFLLLPPVLRSTPVDHQVISALTQTAKIPGVKTNGPSTVGDLITAIVPRNVFQAAVNEDFLPLLIFSILFGLALRHSTSPGAGIVVRFIEGINEALMVLVRWIIWCSPAAMFALAAAFAAGSGARIAGILGRFILYECVLLLALCALLYPLAVLAGGLSLRRFAGAAAGPQMVAVATRSSLAALPSLLDAGEKMLPQNPEPARVVLPIAVAMFKVNRTTSALCRLLVILYFWAVPIEAPRVWTFLVTVMVLSLSDLGIPGGTTFRTVPAYLAAGCPLPAVVLLEVVEPLSDICKTLVNVTGDLSIAAVVARWSKRSARDQALAAVGSHGS